MSDEVDTVPLVIYREVDGKKERIVVGECSVNEDGTMTGIVTEDVDDHTLKAMKGLTFGADISSYAPGAKWTMRQRAEDGTPKK